ncbi:XRE family transcriptional regulator [Streptomyces sp. ICC1]|uniref:XRE family transcriptional regulator n=1 Tax=Streptomyces sp. ICC1 TaxID=2099583 RepID=UPI0013A70A74|nr:XRE family transcriptional regulator [Streptomyces sp. ICC1]
MAETPTLLRVLTLRRHWQVYKTFLLRFEEAAHRLALDENDPSLGGLSVSKRQFERWYGGAVKTRPYPDQCRVLEAMFGVGVDLLLAPAPAPAASPTTPVESSLVIPPPRLSSVLLPSEQAQVLLAGGPFSSETRFEAGTTELERQVAMAARRALRFTAMAEGSSVGPETLGQIQDEVRRLTVAYPKLALPTLLGDLVEVQDLTFRLLEHGRVKPLQARELYLLAGITSGMLAKASHDLGNPSAAMMQARTAFVCADNADHHAMRAWVRSLQSLISYWAGRPSEAADYATLGQNTAGSVRGTTSVWLACLSARAHALLGDGEATRTAIQQAEEARTTLEPDDLDAFGGIMTFPVPRQLYYVAEATVHLGEDPALGESQSEAAVAAYRSATEDEWAFGDEAGAQTDLALARIARGEIEGAIEAVQPVLDLPIEQRNFGITSSAQRVHIALQAEGRRNRGAAASLREEIEAFTATPTSVLVR